VKTTKLIKTYERFDVVLVPFPFIDSASDKKRPALILSRSQTFNIKAGASVMAMITTASHHPWPLDVPLSHLEAAGLPSASIVRMKLFTLDHRLILKKIGTLHKTDQQLIVKSMLDLFSN
jgi:mRNA interferase MazF